MYTYNDVLNAARQVVKDNPNRTNEGRCVITKDGETPHCVVAHVLDTLDHDLFTRTLNKDNYGPLWAKTWWQVGAELRMEFDSHANGLLACVQTYADNEGDGNVEWSEALDNAVADGAFVDD